MRFRSSGKSTPTPERLARALSPIWKSRKSCVTAVPSLLGKPVIGALCRFRNTMLALLRQGQRAFLICACGTGPCTALYESELWAHGQPQTGPSPKLNLLAHPPIPIMKTIADLSPGGIPFIQRCRAIRSSLCVLWKMLLAAQWFSSLFGHSLRPPILPASSASDFDSLSLGLVSMSPS